MLSDVRLSRRRVLVAGSAFAATVLLAACGEAEDEPARNGGGQGGSTTTPEPDPTAPPASEAPLFATEGEEAVLRIEYEGGFMPLEEVVRRPSIVSLFNDGKLVYPGPIPEIFPQPAAPNLLVTTLSERGVEAVGEKVVETGLFEDGDKDLSSNVLITDTAHTVFTVRLAGREPVRVSAYALDLDVDESGLTEEEIEDRRKLRELRDYVTSAPTGFPTNHIAAQETSYEPERLEIITYPWSEVEYDFEVEPEATEWPLDEAPSRIGEPYRFPGHNATCAVLEGDDAGAMLAALRDANALTRWNHLEESVYMINRPLLPGEEGCRSPFDSDEEPGTGDAIEHPTGTDDLVLRYELRGGFVPLEWLVTSMPVASLFGDARMITEGAQIAIYPPPALPALAVDKLTGEGVQMILAEADAAGLLRGKQSWDAPVDFVADAGTGVLTINAGGEPHQVSVYAPGMTGIDDMLSEEELAFRAGFDAFVGKLTNLQDWLPERVFLDVRDGYPTDRLQLVSQPADARPTEEDVKPNEIGWPLDTPLSELGEPFSLLEMSRCFVLEGQEFADVMSLMDDATTITRWAQRAPLDDEEFILHVRPLLPDEEGCQHPYQ